MSELKTAIPVSTRSRAGRNHSGWLVPVGLILLSIVPIIAGALRITELASHPVVTDANARFVNSPVPLIAHVIGASVYCLLGAIQFVPRLRKGNPSWHRIAGRIVVPAGLAAGLSGMWMGVFYTRPEYDTVVRLIFGALMVTSILLGLRAVLRKDFRTHRAWMIRGYAVGIGAGTQVFTALVWLVATGGTAPAPVTSELLLVAGWVINLTIAEIGIRRSVA